MKIVCFTSLVVVLVLATAAPSLGNALRVGHRVENLVVPGSALCPDPDLPCELENRKVKVHLWYPADRRGLSDAPKTEYTSALHRDAPGVADRWRAVADRWDPLTWTVEADIARETDAIDPHGMPFPAGSETASTSHARASWGTPAVPSPRWPPPAAAARGGSGGSRA